MATRWRTDRPVPRPAAVQRAAARSALPALVALMALSVLAVPACGPAGRTEPEENPLWEPPVDAEVVASADEAAKWAYRRRAEADLDGDGVVEALVIAAQAEVDARGRPLWEDGHAWAVYVEAAGGERTLLYGAFVPNGFAEAAILAPSGDGRRDVLVQERTPRRVRALEVRYGGPGAASLRSGAYYELESWLPGSAGLFSP